MDLRFGLQRVWVVLECFVGGLLAGVVFGFLGLGGVALVLVGWARF